MSIVSTPNRQTQCEMEGKGPVKCLQTIEIEREDGLYRKKT
jgi:hypothetical protein